MVAILRSIPRLLEVARQRIEAAEAASPQRVPREETLLMVVGRGTSDPDANSNISKVARMLWEGHGLRLGRGLLQRRHLPAGRARGWSMR